MPTNCVTPECHRKALLTVEGASPIHGRNPAEMCLPCTMSLINGQKRHPAETTWTYRDDIAPVEFQKVRRNVNKLNV